MSFEVTYVNYSSHEWDRWDYKTLGSLNSGGNMEDTPAETLNANSGMQKAAASDGFLSELGHGYFGIQLGYKDKDNDEIKVLVKLEKHTQAFGIGEGCTWKYYKGGEWVDAKHDTTPITWTFDGIKAVATPTLSHTDGSISITISPID
ncbi:hypothetical protein K6Q96_07075 [Grimontia kaedaensis]|uniref:Uncharacterized protein n=1 Tax=Grimontia kaedaensis TaxID=2872157 RepID=A0ABY4WXN5_9GAMM|nr:hypothetical protein [Grimontia kaedaensis]USH03747.1 hypothetical protein K6Q96_07075 [Grimontia kaedaensis]